LKLLPHCCRSKAQELQCGVLVCYGWRCSFSAPMPPGLVKIDKARSQVIMDERRRKECVKDGTIIVLDKLQRPLIRYIILPIFYGSSKT
jgi:hypothetical protein